MLVSFSEYRDRKFRNLQVQRLEKLSESYAKTIRVEREFEVDPNTLDSTSPSRFLYLENLFGGVFSLREIVVLTALGILIVLACAVLKSKLILFSFLPLFLLAKYIKERKQKSLDQNFINEYPSILLATASNLKAGLSVYSALERAIQLLDDDSVTKAEIKQLLEKVSRGVPKEIAVRDFAKDVRLPELRLFKRAFLLVLIHGGKFSRTLERLSEVSRDRDALIKSSHVSTASMRMTGNVLLAMAPILMFLLSLRTGNFWSTMFENSLASRLGFAGASIVLVSFYILRKLSDFKP